MPDCHLENLSVHFSPEILCRILSRTVPSHQKVHFGDVLTLLTNPSDNPPTQNRPGGPNFCGHMSMSTSQRSSTPHCLILTLRRILSVDPDVQSRVRHWTFRWFLFSRDYSVRAATFASLTLWYVQNCGLEKSSKNWRDANGTPMECNEALTLKQKHLGQQIFFYGQ